MDDGDQESTRGRSMKNGLLAAACLGLLLGVGIPIRGAAGDAKKGKAVFEDNCAACHNSDSTETKVGPGLKGLFKRAKLGNGKAVTEANVLGVINEGGDSMPPLGDALKPADKDNLIAYLKTL
jgi:cytochrome c